MNVRVAVPALLALGAGLWFYVKPNYLDGTPAVPPTAAEIAAAPRPTYVVGAHEPFVVNLAPQGGPHYARVQMAVEFEDVEQAYVGLNSEGVELLNEELHEEMDQRLFLIMDGVINVFGSRSADAILSVEKRDALKAELAAAISANLKERPVTGVTFVSLVVQ